MTAETFSRLEDRKLDIAAVAKYLGVSRSKAYSLVERGLLPAMRIDKRIIVSASDVAAFMAARMV